MGLNVGRASKRIGATTAAAEPCSEEPGPSRVSLGHIWMGSEGAFKNI